MYGGGGANVPRLLSPTRRPPRLGVPFPSHPPPAAVANSIIFGCGRRPRGAIGDYAVRTAAGGRRDTPPPPTALFCPRLASREIARTNAAGSGPVDASRIVAAPPPTRRSGTAFVLSG